MTLPEHIEHHYGHIFGKILETNLYCWKHARKHADLITHLDYNAAERAGIDLNERLIENHKILVDWETKNPTGTGTNDD